MLDVFTIKNTGHTVESWRNYIK